MKAVHAQVYDVKKVRTRQVATITLEIPIEAHLDAINLLDEQDVLVTVAPKDIGMPYGVIDGDTAPEQSKPDDEPAKGGALAKLAAQLCANQQFRHFVYQRDCTYTLLESWDEAGIADHVRYMCGVNSRAELDHNPEAAKLFHERFRKPFMDYVNAAK
ncbi:MAG: hypothetical protein MJA28_06360 [Gammaproteobacteria bacterium]|nr:hypothetical protein [Gammaproteobacteria bacterium]